MFIYIVILFLLFLYVDSFDQLVNFLHVLFHLPNLLETFPAKLASQLFFVDLALLAIVYMFNMRRYVVTIKESLSAYFTGVISFTGVGFLEVKIFSYR